MMAKSLLTLLSESCVQPGTISKKTTWGRGEADLSAPDACATKSGFPIIPCTPQDIHKLSVGACRSPWPVKDFLICHKTGWPHPVFLQDGLSENVGLS